MTSAWRDAILTRDAEMVITLDRIFREHPEQFTPALTASAETDPDERVRAFSTRVLGKLASPDNGPLFERLLRDKSPYVRGNAAWGLGELAARDGGRGLVRNVAPALQRLARNDPAPDVRKEASAALRKIM